MARYCLWLIVLLAVLVPFPITSQAQFSTPIGPQTTTLVQSFTVKDAIRMGVPVLSANVWRDDRDSRGSHQCGDGTYHGVMGEGGSDWVGPFFIGPDTGFGGCRLQFVIRDAPNPPGPDLKGLTIRVEFGPVQGARADECQVIGANSPITIPITAFDELSYSPALRFDVAAPQTSGGCRMKFVVEGRSDIGLDIKFYPSPGADRAQCVGGLDPNRWYTASLGKPVELVSATDNRIGGCFQAFRLRFLSGPTQGTPLTAPISSTLRKDQRAIDAANKGVPVMSAIVSHYDAGNSSRGAQQCPRSLDNPGNVYRGIMGMTDGNDWVGPFLITTDDDWGGCQISFLVRDAVGGPSLVGLTLLIAMSPEDPAADPGLCGNSGSHEIPIVAYGEFGGGGGGFEPIFINTDSAHGKGKGCRILFVVGGRADIGLDFQFYPERGADPAQCVNSTGERQWRTASLGRSDGFTIVTDNRPGGCYMAFRLRLLGNTPVPGPSSKPTAATSLGGFSTPANGAQVQGIVPLEVKATVAAGIASVQMAIDGNTTFCKIEMNAPYTCSWDSRKVPNGSHVLSAVIKDKANNSITTPPVTVMVQNQVGAMPVSATAAGPLSGQFSAPMNGVQVRGVVPLEVKATAAAGVASVQMAIDGNTTFCKIEMNAPYTCNWDSRKVPNGSHTLTAVVKDKANKMMSVPPITVVVKN